MLFFGFLMSKVVILYISWIYKERGLKALINTIK